MESLGEEGFTKELEEVLGLLGAAGFDELHTDDPLKGSRVNQVYAKRSAPSDA